MSSSAPSRGSSVDWDSQSCDGSDASVVTDVSAVTATLEKLEASNTDVKRLSGGLLETCQAVGADATEFERRACTTVAALAKRFDDDGTMLAALAKQLVLCRAQMESLTAYVHSMEGLLAGLHGHLKALKPHVDHADAARHADAHPLASPY
jgi:hypothetical protein